MLIFWVAATMGAAFYGLRIKSRRFLLLAGFLFLLGLGLSVASLPAIEKSAKRIAGGRAYCLALPQQHRPVQSRLDLTYVIARGTDVSPHLMFWVDEGDQITAYAWSYLRQSFQRRQPGGVIRNCTPRADFLANLEPAEAGAHFGIGRDLYIIPAEYQPGHLEDRHISIRLRPTAALPATGAAITSGTTAIANWQKLNLRAASGGHPSVALWQ